MEITKEFCKKRISEQIEYMTKIALSDRPLPRKHELMESAFHQATRFLDYYKKDLDILLFFSVQINSMITRIYRARIAPIPKFKNGSVLMEDIKSRMN